MKKVALAVLVATALAVILWDPVVDPFLHRERYRGAVLALFEGLRLGMTKQQVQTVMDSGKYPDLQFHRTDKERWSASAPIEFGAGNWVLLIEFQAEQLSALRVRTADGDDYQPAEAPQDKVAKPVQRVFVSTHYNVPRSLPEMITQADAVVRGRFTGASPRDLDVDQKRHGRAMIAYRLSIDEVLHVVSGRSVGPVETDILTEGGTRDRGAYIEQVIEADFPPLEAGHDYVVFLRWRDTAQGWVVAYGADSVINLGSGNVRSAGNAKITNTYKGKPAAEYVAMVRRYGRDR